MKRPPTIVKVYGVPDELLEHWKEHARDKERSLSNLIKYAMKRYCSMNPLPRERKR